MQSTKLRLVGIHLIKKIQHRALLDIVIKSFYRWILRVIQHAVLENKPKKPVFYVSSSKPLHLQKGKLILRSGSS